MRHKNIAVLWISHKARVWQTDRQTDWRTDRITTPKTALAQLRRAVKKVSHRQQSPLRLCILSWRASLSWDITHAGQTVELRNSQRPLYWVHQYRSAVLMGSPKMQDVTADKMAGVYANVVHLLVPQFQSNDLLLRAFFLRRWPRPSPASSAKCACP